MVLMTYDAACYNTHITFSFQRRGSAQSVRWRYQELRAFQKSLFLWVSKELLEILALGTTWL